MTQSSYASVNGIDLYYEVLGADRPGVPLIMLHGGAYTFRLSFDALLPTLAANRKVIGVEMQGHGHTADSDRPFSIRQCAEDLVAVMDQLGIEQADVVGYSLGGLVATDVAQLVPERIRRLVLAASHFGPTRGAYYTEITALELYSPRMPTADESAAMIRAYEEAAPDPNGFFPSVAKIQPAVHDFPGWTEDQLARLAMPVLIIIGDTDFVRLEHAVEMKQSLPNAQLAILPNTPHMQVIRPDLVLPMMTAFLSQ